MGIFQNHRSNKCCDLSYGVNRIIINELQIQAIPIPNHATNGDVIKAVFPKADIVYDECTIKFKTEGFEFCVQENWWNKSYGESNLAFKE